MITSTLQLLHNGRLAIPASTAWYLQDLGEFRGKQELYTRQSPQRLKVLREHALIESTVSSNRIEGVSVEPSRLKEVLAVPKPLFRDRNEEEVRGYRDALAWIHEQSATIVLNEAAILKCHAMARGEIWDAGKYKARDGDIIERYSDGRERVRFCPVSADETPAAMSCLLEDWRRCGEERWVPPLIALAAFNLDFLCIHPFRDGNGRTSRLLWLLQMYHQGFDVGRYISLERLVEENKERYYETLETSSQGWHEGTHDPWPYINYVMYIMKSAYREFSERVGEMKQPRGAKREQVLAGISRLSARPTRAFSLAELERECPGVSRDMVRRVLREEQSAGRIASQGRGRGARWRPE